MFSPLPPSGLRAEAISFITGLKLKRFLSQLAMAGISWISPALYATFSRPPAHDQLAAPASSGAAEPLAAAAAGVVVAAASSFLTLRFSVRRTDLPTRSRR